MGELIDPDDKVNFLRFWKLQFHAMAQGDKCGLLATVKTLPIFLYTVLL